MTTPATVLGFDYGASRIGVAVGQELTATANPLTTLMNAARGPDWDAIKRLIQEWRPRLLVVGLPRHADGSANAVTAAVLGFRRALGERFQLAVETVDEHLSSHEAERRFMEIHERRPRRAEVDALAAALILESWFNLQQGQTPCSKT
ncbi:MAG: Holliday junction resolvase RuvX [Gammaproteobacteria bacterium]